MKKYVLLIIIIFIKASIYAQVDSMKIYSENNDSIKIIVYTTLQSCYLVDSINYTEQEDSIVVSFYFSEEFPQCECLDCQHQNLFNVERDVFEKVIFNAIIRNCIDNCTSYSDYIQYASGYLLLSGLGIIESQNFDNVKVYQNPITDKLVIEKNNNNIYFLNVFDIYGHKVIGKEIISSEYIDISLLPPGLYIVSINQQGLYKFFKY